ncbi:MAG: aminotransferase class I/II-fold pyridoxal phosphate-dependent enzyme [Rhodovibrionaceae bacterium]|nr:aminotransferase class I/II-fold pyridoxal phosphate-dependent enzyme [Rhodovibrionaceae bacterium]
MGLFDRFQPLISSLDEVSACGANPFGVNLERVLSPTEAVVNGKETLLLGTNNYLGLTFDRRCVDAARQALEVSGTGTTGSRIANGSYSGHTKLEQALAAYYQRDHGLVFTTGYQANLGVISTIAGPDDFLLIDSDSHASIYDACRLGSAKVIRFKHNDAKDLDKRLQRLSGEKGNKVIIVEGIYSMLGDTAPLQEIVEIKNKHGAYLVVDEAHSLGVLGANGRGLAEHAGLDDDVDIIVGTFSKSLGAVGGFAVSSHPEFEILRVACRPYMFTASLPPSVIASVTTALEIIEKEPKLRDNLWANVNYVYDSLDRLGFRLGPTKSPIIAVHIESRELATHVWHELLGAGVYVNLALPPATPGSTSLLRCSICAAHKREQLEAIVRTLAEIGERTSLLPRARAVGA